MGQHTWIVTSIVWAQDSHGTLSIGGDASALVTPVRMGGQQGGGSMLTMVVLLVSLLMVAVAVGLHMLRPEMLAVVSAQVQARVSGVF